MSLFLDRVKCLLDEMSGPNVSAALAAIKTLLALIKESTGENGLNGMSTYLS